MGLSQTVPKLIADQIMEQSMEKKSRIEFICLLLNS